MASRINLFLFELLFVLILFNAQFCESSSPKINFGTDFTGMLRTIYAADKSENYKHMKMYIQM